MCGDVEKLIKKRKSPEECPVYYATIEDTCDIITRMLKHFGQKYANITTEAVELLMSMMNECSLLTDKFSAIIYG